MGDYENRQPRNDSQSDCFQDADRHSNAQQPGTTHGKAERQRGGAGRVFADDSAHSEKDYRENPQDYDVFVSDEQQTIEVGLGVMVKKSLGMMNKQGGEKCEYGKRS